LNTPAAHNPTKPSSNTPTPTPPPISHFFRDGGCAASGLSSGSVPLARDPVDEMLPSVSVLHETVGGSFITVAFGFATFVATTLSATTGPPISLAIMAPALADFKAGRGRGGACPGLAC
jgi:hypothetical protein